VVRIFPQAKLTPPLISTFRYYTVRVARKNSNTGTFPFPVDNLCLPYPKRDGTFKSQSTIPGSTIGYLSSIASLITGTSKFVQKKDLLQIKLSISGKASVGT
jgi:hypothetical protein